MGKISEASKESYDVILLPTRAHVLAWHKAHAGAQSFGIEVNTPDAWLSSLWELYGSACTLISPLERDMALNAALERLKKDLAAGEAEGVLGRGTQDAQNEKIEQLIQTINCPGFVRLAKNIVKKALGLRELEEALSGNVPENLSEAERAMLCLIKHYCALLDELSLIEPGQAITLLPNRLPEYMHISLLLEGVSNLPEQYKRAFCKSKHFDIEEHEALGEEGIVALGENKNLRFAFPSGRYARPLLLADAISEALETPRARFDAPRVIVACKSPKASFDELTPAFCKHGISAEVKDTRKFSQTDFGKALNISYKLVTPAENSSISADEFIDLLHIPFSEISPQLAREIDAKLRADRLLDVEVAYALSCEQSSVLSLLQEMAQDVQAFLVAGALEDMLYARIHLGEAYISEQIAALNAAKEAMYLASKLSLKMGSCLNVLNETSVNSSASLVLEAGEVEEQIASTQATGKHETASAQTALSTSTPPTTATPTTAPSAPTPPTTAPDVLICTWACASVFAEESCEVLIA